MSSYVPLVQGVPYQESSLSKYEKKLAAEDKKKFRIPTGLIWTIAIVVVLVIVIYAVYVILQQEREVIEIPYANDILNLDELIDITATGQCCIPPAVASFTPRWVYNAGTNFTYSIDSLDPEIVCGNLAGVDQTACLNKCSDENGDPKVVAHRGIIPYYCFAVGQPSTVCSSFTPCPL